jgi:Uma2 family endonuclease
MNQPFRSPDLSRTTQAAEGLMRRRWSVAEIEEATRLGLFDDDERFELIGGEIVPMNAKGIQHEILKSALTYHFVRSAPEEFRFIQETTFRLSEDSFVEPDFIFFRTSDGVAGLNPRTALLAIEVADSSLRWDLGRKARIYANFGLPELWVIDATTRIVHVHRKPGLEGYGDINQHTDTATVDSVAVSGLTVNLSKLRTF